MNTLSAGPGEMFAVLPNGQIISLPMGALTGGATFVVQAPQQHQAQAPSISLSHPGSQQLMLLPLDTGSALGTQVKTEPAGYAASAPLNAALLEALGLGPSQLGSATATAKAMNAPATQLLGVPFSRVSNPTPPNALRWVGARGIDKPLVNQSAYSNSRAHRSVTAPVPSGGGGPQSRLGGQWCAYLYSCSSSWSGLRALTCKVVCIERPPDVIFTAPSNQTAPLCVVHLSVRRSALVAWIWTEMVMNSMTRTTPMAAARLQCVCL